MKICGQCGCQSPDMAEFCNQCGYRFDPQTYSQNRGGYQNQSSYQNQVAGRNQNGYQNPGSHQNQNTVRNQYPAQQHPASQYPAQQGRPPYSNAPYDPYYDPYGAGQRPVPYEDPQSGLKTAIKVFMVIGCVLMGFGIIPLAWCIPMTVSVYHSLRDHRNIGMAMKICTLLFVSLIAGILLLCLKDEPPADPYHHNYY